MRLKTPLVTAVAVISLALGIGVNAAIYSLFDQIRPMIASRASAIRWFAISNAHERCTLESPRKRILRANIAVRNEPMTGPRVEVNLFDGRVVDALVPG